MKKRIIIASAAIVMGGLATLVGTAGATYAASATSTTKPAQSVRREWRAREDAKLNQAVRDGVITDAQKTAFQTELKTLREARKSSLTSTSTKSDREAAHAKLKSDLKAWATTNNFPLAKIFPKLAE